MTRFRSFAMSITLALLVTGCYTQLRAPHQTRSHHRDVRVSSAHNTLWRHHSPVFYVPTYSRYDEWLYRDCDIWVDRYYDYHPWLARHGVHFFLDVHAHPGRRVWRGHRYDRRSGWYGPRRGRGRYRGPRFEPLSPTIEIEVVTRRGRFRRDGFAGGVPGRGEGLVTVRGSGISAGEDGSVRGAETRTVRVTRPRKIERAFVHSAQTEPGQGYSNQEITWESWQKGRPASTSPEGTRSTDRQSGDTGRDSKSWGPAPKVDERSSRQPKLQTNWFNPNATQTVVDEGSDSWKGAESSETDRSQRKGKRPVWTPVTGDKGSTAAGYPSDVRRGGKGPDAWSAAVNKASAGGKDYAVPKGERVRERESVRDDRDRRRDESPQPEVRDPEPASRTWAKESKEKREKPKPNYAAPRKEQRKQEREQRSTKVRDSQKKDSDKDKDEEKRQNRKEKRKKSRKRRGM